MPFVSPQQERFMFARHPAIAKRWFREYGHAERKTKNANPQSESHETWKKATESIPRLPAIKRDFGALTPNPSARMSPKTQKRPTILESDKEPKGMTFQPGARPGKLGEAKDHPSSPMHRRDSLVATRKKV